MIGNLSASYNPKRQMYWRITLTGAVVTYDENPKQALDMIQEAVKEGLDPNIILPLVPKSITGTPYAPSSLLEIAAANVRDGSLFDYLMTLPNLNINKKSLLLRLLLGNPFSTISDEASARRLNVLLGREDLDSVPVNDAIIECTISPEQNGDCGPLIRDRRFDPNWAPFGDFNRSLTGMILNLSREVSLDILLAAAQQQKLPLDKKNKNGLSVLWMLVGHRGWSNVDPKSVEPMIAPIIARPDFIAAALAGDGNDWTILEACVAPALRYALSEAMKGHVETRVKEQQSSKEITEKSYGRSLVLLMQIQAELSKARAK